MLAVNIPADGLFLAIQNAEGGDLSKDNCERIINEYMDRFLEAKPDIIFLNVCYRRCLTPSEVFDSYLYNVETDENGYAIKNGQSESVKTFSPVTDNVSKYFMSFVLCARKLLQSGIDIYQFAINRIRQTECRVFLSVRMNDAHYTENAAINSSFALKNECKNTIEHNGKNLDYSNVWGKDGPEACPAWSEVAWWTGNSDAATHPVGLKRPNAFGLYDMHGNVLEHCMDWYERGLAYSDGSHVVAPKGPVSSSYSKRVLKGGSFANYAPACRSASREKWPFWDEKQVGFRLKCLPYFGK